MDKQDHYLSLCLKEKLVKLALGLNRKQMICINIGIFTKFKSRSQNLNHLKQTDYKDKGFLYELYKHGYLKKNMQGSPKKVRIRVLIILIINIFQKIETQIK